MDGKLGLAWTGPRSMLRDVRSGRTELALSAGVGLRWPVNLALSGLTAERNLAVTVALKELAPSLHLCKNVNQKANTNQLSLMHDDSQI